MVVLYWRSAVKKAYKIVYAVHAPYTTHDVKAKNVVIDL